MIRRPKFKVSRRLGDRIHPKTQSAKYSISAAKKGPAHNIKKQSQKTEYGLQFMEKQKVRLTYGLTEKQFRKYVDEARSKSTGGTPATKLYELLERRLDNVVYKLGLASSRPAGRQMVSHGHIMVNGHKFNIPSYHVKKADKISIREGSAKSKLFEGLETKMKTIKIPAWMLFDEVKKEAVITASPVFNKNESAINLGAIIEFYSRV